MRYLVPYTVLHTVCVAQWRLSRGAVIRARRADLRPCTARLRRAEPPRGTVRPPEFGTAQPCRTESGIFSTPSTAGNSIYTEKNYNSGGVVANESAKDAKTAHVTIYHDAQHP